MPLILARLRPYYYTTVLMWAVADTLRLSSLRLTNVVFTTLSLKMNWSHPSALLVNIHNMPFVFCKEQAKMF